MKLERDRLRSKSEALSVTIDNMSTQGGGGGGGGEPSQASAVLGRSTSTVGSAKATTNAAARASADNRKGGAGGKTTTGKDGANAAKPSVRCVGWVLLLLLLLVVVVVVVLPVCLHAGHACMQAGRHALPARAAFVTSSINTMMDRCCLPGLIVPSAVLLSL